MNKSILCQNEQYWARGLHRKAALSDGCAVAAGEWGKPVQKAVGFGSDGRQRVEDTKRVRYGGQCRLEIRALAIRQGASQVQEVPLCPPGVPFSIPDNFENLKIFFFTAGKFPTANFVEFSILIETYL